MDSESAQTFNVVLITVAVLFQTILLIGIALSVSRIRRSVEQFTSDAHRFLDTAGQGIENLNVSVTQVSAKLQTGLEQAECMTDEVLARSKAHALALDHLIGDFLATAGYVNREMGQITKGSFREVRALNAGLRAALSSLFQVRRSKGRATR